MSPLVFPAFPFLAMPGPVMITTTPRRYISWQHLEALAIPRVSSCCPHPTSAGQKMTLYFMWRDTGEKGLLELDLLLLQRYALSLSLLTILTVLLHFWMADGCIICKSPSPCTHSVCLACPARWLGFGSARCSCWDHWLEKHLPPEPVN